MSFSTVKLRKYKHGGAVYYASQETEFIKHNSASGFYTEYPRTAHGPINDVVSQLLKTLSCSKGADGKVPLDDILGPDPLSRWVGNDSYDGQTLPNSALQNRSDRSAFLRLSPPGLGNRGSAYLSKSYTVLGVGNQSTSLNDLSMPRPQALQQLRDFLTVFNPINTVDDLYNGLLSFFDQIAGFTDENEPYQDFWQVLLKKHQLNETFATPEIFYRETTIIPREGPTKERKVKEVSCRQLRRTGLMIMRDIVKMNPAIKPEKRNSDPRNIFSTTITMMALQCFIEAGMGLNTGNPYDTNNMTNDEVWVSAENFIDGINKRHPVKVKTLSGNEQEWVPMTLTVNSDATKYNSSIKPGELQREAIMQFRDDIPKSAQLICTYFSLFSRKGVSSEVSLSAQGERYEVPGNFVGFNVLRQIKYLQQNGKEALVKLLRSWKHCVYQGAKKRKAKHILEADTIFEEVPPILFRNPDTLYMFGYLPSMAQTEKTSLETKRMSMGMLNKTACSSQSRGILVNLQAITECYSVMPLLEKEEKVHTFLKSNNPLMRLIEHSKLIAKAKGQKPGLGSLMLQEYLDLPKDHYLRRRAQGMTFLEIIQDTDVSCKQSDKIITMQAPLLCHSAQRSDDGFENFAGWGPQSKYLVPAFLGAYSSLNRVISPKKTTANYEIKGSLFARTFQNWEFSPPAGNAKRAIEPVGASVMTDLMTGTNSALTTLQKRPQSVMMAIAMANDCIFKVRARYRIHALRLPLFNTGESTNSIKMLLNEVGYDSDKAHFSVGGNFYFSTLAGFQSYYVLESTKPRSTKLFLSKPMETQMVERVNRGHPDDYLLETNLVAAMPPVNGALKKTRTNNTVEAGLAQFNQLRTLAHKNLLLCISEATTFEEMLIKNSEKFPEAKRLLEMLHNMNE